MDRLKEDLDELCSSVDLKKADEGDDSDDESDEDDSDESGSKSDSNSKISNDKSDKDDDSNSNNESNDSHQNNSDPDKSDDDKDSSEETDPNTNPTDCLNGGASFRRTHPHSDDLTIILNLENPEGSQVYDGTDLVKITDRAIDLEDEVPLYRKNIVYSIINNKLVDMSDAWDIACLAREKRIKCENERYKNLIKEKSKINKSFSQRSYQEVFA